MTRADGCRIWDQAGREYLDTVMALGAVALGYAHPAVVRAVEEAARRGVVGSLPPVLEEEVAARLADLLPGAEATRFFKTGAEAVAAAVRIARVHTGRDHVITCGYHGWLDWCQSGAGVPEPIEELRREIRFNDVAALERAVRELWPIAAIVVEPVVDAAPQPDWLDALRKAADTASAVLVFDEIKTAFRLAVGGAAQRFGVTPDLMVTGKALGNGLPIAAVSGPRPLMEAASRTWISSTLATEYVSLAAARAVLETMTSQNVTGHLAAVGSRFFSGLERLAAQYPKIVAGVRGVPEMCYLAFPDEGASATAALLAAERGLLFKRTAYNFVSLAHTESVIDEILVRLEAALEEAERRC
ncbi:MAG: aminotransferase class III-fold pyridoxal phosphate-dependent enzyme [Gemmatimonadetes bacterium]|nr:aminotransferase class III-fold pyridoxal phosphate-dependent enzyme [Gemmatimonadota bacterium]